MNIGEASQEKSRLAFNRRRAHSPRTIDFGATHGAYEGHGGGGVAGEEARACGACDIAVFERKGCVLLFLFLVQADILTPNAASSQAHTLAHRLRRRALLHPHLAQPVLPHRARLLVPPTRSRPLSYISGAETLTLTVPSPPFTPASLFFTLSFLYTGTLVFSRRTYDLSTALALLSVNCLSLQCFTLRSRRASSPRWRTASHGRFHAALNRRCAGGCTCRKYAYLRVRAAPRCELARLVDASADVWDVIMRADGVRLEDGERVEWAMRAVVRGVDETNAGRVYQPSDEGTFPAQPLLSQMSHHAGRASENLSHTSSVPLRTNLFFFIAHLLLSSFSPFPLPFPTRFLVTDTDDNPPFLSWMSCCGSGAVRAGSRATAGWTIFSASVLSVSSSTYQDARRIANPQAA
ncbi:hypothetical protein FB451DRAFT_1574053 [Mycena latifolia]|nr:hypothetical protein FB451DRAFT_1574053 [Mycena latifolia]